MDATSKPSNAFNPTVTAITRICAALIGDFAMMSRGSFKSIAMFPSFLTRCELLVLGADFIDELGIGSELLPQRHGPRLGIRFGIIHRHFDFEMSEIRPPDPLAKFC